MTKPRFPHTIPTLATDRLLLRQLRMQDAPAVYRNFSNPAVVKYFMEPLQSLADAETMVQELIGLFEAGKGMFWALTLKGSQELIGTCSFERFSGDRRGEVGFDLAQDCWGKGLMSEALAAVIDYGFGTFNLKEIYAITAVDNRRATRLLKRLGFQVGEEQKNSLRLRLKRKNWRMGGELSA